MQIGRNFYQPKATIFPSLPHALCLVNTEPRNYESLKIFLVGAGSTFFFRNFQQSETRHTFNQAISIKLVDLLEAIFFFCFVICNASSVLFHSLSVTLGQIIKTLGNKNPFPPFTMKQYCEIFSHTGISLSLRIVSLYKY